MAGRSTSNTPERAKLSREDLELGIKRIRETRIELEKFDVASITKRHPPELTTLGQRIERSLEKTFGANSAQFQSYSYVAMLGRYSAIVSGNPPALFRYKKEVDEAVQESIAVLNEVVRDLTEDLDELNFRENASPDTLPTESAPAPASNKVFVVHGHDGEAKEGVARFLMGIGFKPIILHEQASKGKTIIEKIEAHSDVGFAVVLLTPDDFGGVVKDSLRPRARQNVILELGYFIARLGRDRVCALRKGDVEIPSDILGVVYTELDSNGAWKVELSKEMQAVGLEIDFNKVMRA